MAYVICTRTAEAFENHGMELTQRLARERIAALKASGIDHAYFVSLAEYMATKHAIRHNKLYLIVNTETGAIISHKIGRDEADDLLASLQNPDLPARAALSHNMAVVPFTGAVVAG